MFFVRVVMKTGKPGERLLLYCQLISFAVFYCAPLASPGPVPGLCSRSLGA